MRFLLAFFLCTLSALAADPLAGAERIVFLGDSITYAGQYIVYFEAHMLTAHPERRFEVLNVGLPSETTSGLSEEGHADGKFPRPDVHERLDRVLAKIKPDLVFACYGMNDGIYLALSDERFARYQAGIRKLREKVLASGAKIIHLTPPIYDLEPVKGKASMDPEKPQYIKYGEVLDLYSQWLVGRREQGWTVIDIHTPMRDALVAGRAKDPAFIFAKDGVHPNEAGHQVIASALLTGLGEKPALEKLSPELLKLVRERQGILKDAWLSATGHQRPGMRAGLPLEEAQQKAAAITPKIRAVLQQK